MLAEIIWSSESTFWVCVFSVPVVTIIGGVWYKIERAKSDNELKRRMVERGMSVEEIDRVMASGPKE